jgi:sec-independent protein translocase protein TatA
MFGLGIWELLAIFLVVLLLFGAKRLPEIGGSLGKGIREFKGSIKEVESDVRDEIEAPKNENEASSASRDPASVAKSD